MKRKILVTLSVLFIFGMFAAVYAYQAAAFTGTETTCCKHAKGDHAVMDKDSCPMADCCKDGQCDRCENGNCTGDCCKDHDSCPMKTGQSPEAATADTVAVSDKHGSCPHKKG